MDFKTGSEVSRFTSLNNDSNFSVKYRFERPLITLVQLREWPE